MHDLQEHFKESVQFLAIYISEAHAVDEWPIGSKVAPFEQHRTLEERLTVANKFVTDFDYKITTLVDNMVPELCFERQMGAWPEQFYIIDKKGLISFIGTPNEQGFPPSVFRELKEHLTKALAPPRATGTSSSSVASTSAPRKTGILSWFGKRK